MATRVYRYGLRAPYENAELVWNQMVAAHRYRNKLVEIERARRAEVRAQRSSDGTIAALEASAKAADAAVQEALVQVKRAKEGSRTRKVPDHLRQALNIARLASRDAVAAVRTARKALMAEDGAFRVALDQIEEKYAAIRREARANCGVYWGTYLLIEDQDQAVRKSLPLYQLDGITPNDPHFVRWEGEGQVGVQIQGGMSVSELEDDLRFTIQTGSLPRNADPTSKRSSKFRYIDVGLRVGSGGDNGRRPIWAKWRGVMHRPLPQDAVIKRAAVTCRRVGMDCEWALLVSFESDSVSMKNAGPSNGSIVAVDIGWRVVEGGLRVAAWRGSDGQHGTLVLDDRWCGAIQKSDSIRSIRDRSLEGAKTRLVESLRDVVLPDWFPKMVMQIVSHERFHRLAKIWAENRFDGDEVAFTEFAAHMKNDEHLWNWEAHQRAKSLRIRKDKYRRFAARLAHQYDTIVIERFDLREVARRPDVLRHEGDNEQARANRQMAAVSELRMAIWNVVSETPPKTSAQLACGRIREAPAEYSTQTCSYCGSRETWNQAAELTHTCSACGTLWDQDENATQNLLAWASQVQSVRNAVESGTKTNRWDRAKKMAAEKRLRTTSAA